QVVWRLQNQEGRPRLVRTDIPWPGRDTETEPAVLDERITGFSARFYGRNGWKDQWDARRDGLPQLVELNLTVQTGVNPVNLRSAVRLPSEERF
ncbi:MAG: hypothetical protein D6794_10275, partial [Deltaproteobacteria bacterium]